MLQRQRDGVPEPDPVEPVDPVDDDPAWLEGHVDPGRLPGGWRATFE